MIKANKANYGLPIVPVTISSMDTAHYYTTSDQGLGAYLLYSGAEIHRVDQKDPRRFQVTFFLEQEGIENLVKEYISGKETRMSPLRYALCQKQFKSIIHSSPFSL